MSDFAAFSFLLFSHSSLNSLDQSYFPHLLLFFSSCYYRIFKNRLGFSEVSVPAVLCFFPSLASMSSWQSCRHCFMPEASFLRIWFVSVVGLCPVAMPPCGSSIPANQHRPWRGSILDARTGPGSWPISTRFGPGAPQGAGRQ